MPPTTLLPPLATCRIQLTPDFGFAAAEGLVPHLADVGITHVYLSPVLRATPGSRHGYDVVDPHHIDLDRGGEHAFASLLDTIRAHGLGVLLDVVPNHLAGDPRGAAWADVLRHGRGSGYARWFDLAWSSGNSRVRDRILLPVLGTELDDAVRAGDVRLARCAGEVVLQVYDQQLPLSNESIAEITSAVASTVAGPPHVREQYAALAEALRTSVAAGVTTGVGGRPGAVVTDTALQVQHGQRLAAMLAALADTDHGVGHELDVLLAAMSADGATMRWVLDQQHYELAHWREGTRRLDRRRFFDVAELVGVRQEDPEVFEATHARVVALVHSGAVDGLRIDHPDGLSDPTGYLTRLRAEIGDAWLVVEKILSEGEELPSAWPVDGTVGYEHGAVLDRLFVDPAGEAPLTELVRRHVADADGVPTDDLDAVIDRAKRDALEMLFRPELARLVALGGLVCADAPTCTPADVRRAVVEMVVAFPVYRTYVRPGEEADVVDGEVLDECATRAGALLREAGELAAASLVDRLRSLFDHGERTSGEETFVVRFQQLTSAVTAKGVEDTAFYRIPRLLTLNEVGADPRRWSVAPDEFHAHRALAARRTPWGLVATSTHDSKRSADARFRLAALSEVPDLYAAAVDRVVARLDELLADDGATVVPRDRLLELLVIQLVVAVHPASADRLVAAATKAVREAKRLTTWHDPDAPYEAGVERIVRALLDDPVCRDALRPVLDVVEPAGRRTSLAATLLTFAGPGVPDLYQAWPGWQLALADPDNRDDVDVSAVARLAHDAGAAGAAVWTPSSLADDVRGLTKAHLIRTCLQVRHAHAAAVTGDELVPLAAEGAAADHVVASVASAAGVPHVVTVASRLHVRLACDGGWRGTVLRLPPGRWVDALRCGRASTANVVEGVVLVDDLLGGMPGALLVPAA